VGPFAIRRALVAALLCCAAAGCQSHSDPSSASGGSAGTAADSGATASAKPIDACSMVSPQDISSLLGASVQGKPTTQNAKRGGCVWENTTTSESVTLEIGTPDSAPHNTLPKPLPGLEIGALRPDGMRTNSEGVVQFASGNRDNSVQVAVVRISADERIAAGLDLVRKISPQIPQ
jgi:hypothetical protein